MTYQDVLSYGYVAPAGRWQDVSSPILGFIDKLAPVVGAGGGGATSAVIPLVGPALMLWQALSQGISPQQTGHNKQAYSSFVADRQKDIANVQAMQAAGKITAEQAATLIASFKKQATDLGAALDRTNPAIGATGIGNAAFPSGGVTENAPGGAPTASGAGVGPNFPDWKTQLNTLGPLLGGMLGGRMSGTKKTATKDLSAISQFLLGQGKALIPTATGAIGTGLGTYGPVIDYYRTLLSGDRNAMSKLLGPEIQQIGQGYASAFRTSSELTPRSGIAASTRANLPFDEARDIGNLFMSVRPMAAQNLFATGRDLTSKGINMFGAATGAAGGATLAAGELGSLGLGLWNQSAKAGAGWGQLIQQIIQQQSARKKATDLGVSNPSSNPWGV